MGFILSQLLGFGAEADDASAPTDVYLLEGGDDILLETGDSILLEEG